MKVLNFISIAIGIAFWVFCLPLILIIDDLERLGAFGEGTQLFLSDIEVPVLFITLIVGISLATALIKKVNCLIFDNGLQIYHIMLVFILGYIGMEISADVPKVEYIMFLISINAALAFLIWLVLSVREILME